jgi:hypothetical protein
MNTRASKIGARTAPWLSPRLWLALGVLAAAAGIAAVRTAQAQDAQAVQIASADQLADLVGPIALYPDDLVAIVLPASTYPLQVVQAARFLEDRQRDSSLQPDEDWDESVVALLNYPEVVELLNGDLDWMYDLGAAVLNQRADVLNAIQTFRDQAYAAGNLRTDDRQTVARDDGEIVIKPANPQVIYVPYYEPERVVIYQTVPVYHYYPRRYPVYYYPYPAHYVFDTGYFWGVRSWFSIGWHSHLVHVYDPFYRSHPYFGWSYYDPWYPRNVYVNINVNRNRDYVWEPRQRYGGRPVVRGYEGRVYSGTTQPPRSGGGTTGGAYRSRSVESTNQAGQAAGARQPRRGVLDSNRATTTAPRTESNVYRGNSAASRTPATVNRDSSQRGTAVVPERTYRSGGDTPQAVERARAQPQSSQSQTPSRVYRSAPQQRERATQPSTGMPRESSRSFEAQAREPRAAPQVSREPSGGGISQAQRGGGDGGSYRGGGNSSSDRGGNSGGGGREHAAARGSEGRAGR